MTTKLDFAEFPGIALTLSRVKAVPDTPAKSTPPQ